MMKKFLVQLLLFSALTLFLPIAAAALCGGAPQTSAFTTFLSQQESTTGQSAQTQDDAQAVVLPILNSATGEVEQVPLRDFLIGRRRVRCRPVIRMRRSRPRSSPPTAMRWPTGTHSRANPDPDLKGAWFAANPDGHEGYIRPDGLKAVWGDQYQEYYDRLAALVDEVGGLVVTYEGNPALTTYYALCNGTTETSEAVWGQALPYLVSVDSALDLTSPDCEQTLTLSMQDVYDKLNLAFYTLDLSGTPDTWVWPNRAGRRRLCEHGSDRRTDHQGHRTARSARSSQRRLHRHRRRGQRLHLHHPRLWARSRTLPVRGQRAGDHRQAV